MKINVGDKVVVKKPNNEKEGGLIWSTHMDGICSKEITVSNFIVDDIFLVEENTWAYKTSWVTHVNGQAVARPYENWKMSISKSKFKRCTEKLPVYEVEGIIGFIDEQNNIFYYRPTNDKFISAKVYPFKYPDDSEGWEFVKDNCDSESRYVGNIDLYDVGITHYEEDGSALLVPAEKLMKLEWEGSSEGNVIASFSVVGGGDKGVTEVGASTKNSIASTLGVPERYLGNTISNDTKLKNSIDQYKKSKTNTEWTDKHYDFNYTLTEDDIEKGVIKIDPYFVNRMWKVNSWDDTGAAFHSLKNYARISNGKNPLERDLTSLYKQVKRLCELHGVLLE